MSIGLRVVRGPNWKFGDKDGGEGHIGTVISVKDDNTAEVVWDNGNQVTCRIGKDRQKDLRVIDNAPAGIKHFGMACKECKRQPILGTRWACVECKGVNLCTICYHSDKHDLKHSFQRFNRQTTSMPERVPKRSISQNLKGFGIFPEAVVERGKDWNYGNDDGGPGSKGIVLELKNYSNDTGARNAVKVKWRNGKIGEYKIGASGKVDVKYIEPGVGFSYYRDHLYVPDSSRRLTEPHSARSNKVRTQPLALGYLEVNDSSVEEAENPGLDTVLHVGDRVCVFLPAEELKEVQHGRGGWSMRMIECIGQIGKVNSIESDEIIEVVYEEITWQFYQGAVRKVYDVKVGDTVKILNGEKMVELLQKGHGGWEDSMAKACGKVGKVEQIDNDGDVMVQFGEQVLVYSPACLIPAPGKTIDMIKNASTTTPGAPTSTRRENARQELGDTLARLVAHMMILGHHQQQLSTIGPEHMAQAAAKGDIDSVKEFIKLKKELVNCKFKDLTPLMLATHEGHIEIMKLLLTNGADINAQSEDGTTAVLVAAAGKKENLAIFLINNRASVLILDKNKRSLAHHASYAGMFSLLSKVLQKGCDPNLQDVEGDTALHDAIVKCHDKAVDLLLARPTINLILTNNKDFNPLIFAALKQNNYATTKLLEKCPDLVNKTKKDGSTALHVAAINDHREVAETLITKDADVDQKDNNGHTPIHLACHEGYFEMVELLIKNEAEVNEQDDNGLTPLHLTLVGQQRQLPGLLGLMLSKPNDDSERVKIACLLLNNGAKVDIQDKTGKMPLQVCRSPRVKSGVENFIRQRKQKAQARVTGDPFLQLMADLLVVPCIACNEDVANATFKPCGHKIVCETCSVRFDQCPNCRSAIAERTDNEGRQIVLADPCMVQ